MPDGCMGGGGRNDGRWTMGVRMGSENGDEDDDVDLRTALVFPQLRAASAKMIGTGSTVADGRVESFLMTLRTAATFLSQMTS
ncbi:unnamed protein product [Penicillium manginii]